MKIKDIYSIVSNKKINDNNGYEMVLRGNTSALNRPGSFVDITVPGYLLPRPFSVSYVKDDKFSIHYKVVGEGTEVMSKMEPGESLEILTGLGNGYDLDVDSKKPLLVGGGTGVASLYWLALELIEKGVDPTIVLGFRSAEDMMLVENYYVFTGNDKLILTLENDNYNIIQDIKSKIKGKLVTDVMDDLDYDYFYACGPKGMLKAVTEKAKTDGEVSLESRMACGIGQCKCCSIETNDGMKTLCNDGPVLKKKLVRW